jgi:hypothetical protein
MNDGIEGLSKAPLPHNYKRGLADEVQAWLHDLPKPADTQQARASYDDLHERVHPIAEAYVRGIDPLAVQADFTQMQRQFLSCLSHEVAAHLYSTDELLELSIDTFLNFAIIAMMGWRAHEDFSRRQLRLPADDGQG